MDLLGRSAVRAEKPQTSKAGLRYWLAARGERPEHGEAMVCRESPLRYTPLPASPRCGSAMVCRESPLRYTGVGELIAVARAMVCRESPLRYTKGQREHGGNLGAPLSYS